MTELKAAMQLNKEKAENERKEVVQEEGWGYGSGYSPFNRWKKLMKMLLDD